MFSIFPEGVQLTEKGVGRYRKWECAYREPKCTYSEPLLRSGDKAVCYTSSSSALPRFDNKFHPNRSAYAPHVSIALPAITRYVRPRSPIQIHIARTYRWSATWTSSLPNNRNKQMSQSGVSQLLRLDRLKKIGSMVPKGLQIQVRCTGCE